MSDKKTGLNQRHWLNIIIITISALFLLSVLIGRMMNKNPADDLPLDNKLEIIKIVFNGSLFEKKQQGWQSINPNVNKQSERHKLESKYIQSIVNRWQKLLLQQGLYNKNIVLMGETVDLYLSTLSQPIKCKLWLVNDQLHIYFVDSHYEFILNDNQLSDFYYFQKY